MFTDKKSKTQAVIGNQQNRITEGTSIVGDMISKAGLRIDGSIQGNIKSPSKVVVGENGTIKGTLECENADIEGKFYGKMNISGTLTLKSTALLDGEVVAGKLAIEPGASFNATCVMKGAVKSMNTQQQETAIKSQNHLFEREKNTAKAEQAN